MTSLGPRTSRPHLQKKAKFRWIAAAPGFGEFDGEEEPARDCSG
jgi:hypothetical protein